MKDGKAQISIASVNAAMTYKWVDDNNIEITIDMGAGAQTQQMGVKIDGNKLSLTSEGQTIEFTKK
jgi:hypothetical protein